MRTVSAAALSLLLCVCARGQNVERGAVPERPSAAPSAVPSLPALSAPMSVPAGQTVELSVPSLPSAAQAAGLPATSRVSESALPATPAGLPANASAAAQATHAQQAAPEIPSASAALESAARRIETSAASRVASSGRIVKVIRSASALFASKKDDSSAVPAGSSEESPSGLAPSDGSGKAAPPAPPAPPSGPKSVLSPSVLGFFSSFVFIQVAVESLGLAVPQMSDPFTQGFLVLGALSAIGYVAYSLGSLVGGRWVEKLGIRRVYRSVLVVRAVIWGGAALLFNAKLQTMSIGPLIALFSLDYFVHSIGRVAEHTLQVSWFRDSPVTSSRFATMRDFVEYGTVFAMLGAGLLIAKFGYGAILWGAFGMFAAAAALSFILKSLPSAAAEAGHKVSLVTGFKTLFADKSLRRLFASQMLINNFFYLLYYVTATAFSVFVAHGNHGFAAETASSLTGVYGIGAIVGTVAMTAISSRIEKRTAALPEAERAQAQAELLRKSASRSLVWSAIALLGSWLLVSTTPLGVLVWPLFAVSPALLAIGATAQISLIHIDAMMKDRIPREVSGSVVGAVRALTNMSYALSFLIWGGLFQLLHAGGLVAMGAWATLIAGAYLWLSRKLS